MENKKPVIGFAARSGTGKTTLIEKLIPLLTAQDIRLAIIKHSHHNVQIDSTGKDSYRFREAGAQQILLATPKQWLLTSARDQSIDPPLAEAIDHITLDDCDLILVEGYRQENIPKIEIYRKTLNRPLLYLQDPHIIAVASDSEIENISIPVLPLNEPYAIAEFIQTYMGEF